MNRRRQSLGRTGSERGYAAILTALLLVPLMGFAGFAVDIGAWYSQASSLQRASDAAALAGVVWQPNFSSAESAARAEATRNGFTHGVDGITVTVSDTGNNRLEVEIIDTDADLYFASLFIDNVTIGRRAVAEYVDSVPLGSPEGRFGTGDLTPGGAPAVNFWAALSGYCTSKDMGDQVMVRYEWIGWGGCESPSGSWDINGDYDPAGYWYGIDKPAALATGINVDIYDQGACDGSSGDIDSVAGNNPPGAFNTVWTLHQADSTPLNDYDNPVYATVTSTEGGICGGWNTMFTIPASGPSGRWIVNVRTQAADNALGHNLYGIWARRPADVTPCSALSDSTCPNVFGIKRISVTVDSAGVATENFFLAEIAEVHAGKQMKISLWDTADGMDFLKILDPLGNPYPFTYETADGAYGPSANNSCGGDPCLQVYLGGGWPYNGRLIEMTIDLPTSATYASYPNDWWKLNYQALGSSVWDRTTWGVEVLGDPVRLLE